MIPTADPHVFIEDHREGYVRYINVEGARWSVTGVCDHRGVCILGAVIDGEEVTTIDRARDLAHAYKGLDVPVAPGFSGCCPLKVVEL